MIRKRIIFIVLLNLVLTGEILFAQQNIAKVIAKKIEGGFKKVGRYKKYNEVIFGVGAANFLGEVGGADQIGTYFIKDLDFKATKPSTQFAYRSKINDRWSLKGGLYFNTVSGADSLTKEIYRHNRNLSFRTRIVELSGQVEYYFVKEKPTKNYKIRGEDSKSFTRAKVLPYAFIGIGFIYFNPKAKYNDSWYALQPLGTEGQGLIGAPEPYSRITTVIPFGIGIKQPINKNIYLGFEYGIRKTYSDYIDDVSGVYYDNGLIRTARGDIAAYLADPKLHNVPEEIDPEHYYDTPGPYKTNANQGAAGEQRGNIKNKDTYMFMNLTIGYKFKAKKKKKKSDKSEVSEIVGIPVVKKENEEEVKKTKQNSESNKK